jgi:RNA polymerase sigma factor (sigma-70 family)
MGGCAHDVGRCAHDDELVRRALAGDARAFALLYVRYRNVVWKLAYYKLGDRDDADDVMQQTFLKALRELSRYRASGSFKAWLLTICRNACNDRRRSAKAVLSLERLDQDQLAGRASTVDAAEWMTVRSAISKLPCQEAVAWFLIDVVRIRLAAFRRRVG